ncbi:hypothetical protein [Actinoplanes subglobosus]|uniref:Integral membrane protein n=1 Tax=Actinoplanes subglobosus TaxID=1547892 RepID=A0ABV8IWP8_9ACTN
MISSSTARPARQSLRQALRTNLTAGTLWSRGNWRLAVTVVAAAAAAVVVVVGLAALAVTTADQILATGSDSLTSWLSGNRVAASITGPLRSWFDTAHAGGVPATGGELWLLWVHTTTALWLAAVCGSLFARIGWALIGALTTAAVHTGAQASTAGVCAATAVTAWLLLSLAAYNRPAARAAARRQAASRGGDGDA